MCFFKRNITLIVLLIYPFMFWGAEGKDNQNVMCKVYTQNHNESSDSYFGDLFTTEYWPDRWHCGQWSEQDGWISIISDSIIFFSYLMIPIFLLVYLRRRNIGKLNWLVVLFGGFILLCGITHLLEVIIFWMPMYRFLGFVKILTAIFSFVTAIVLAIVIPRALQYRSPDDMQNEISTMKNTIEKSHKTLHENEKMASLGQLIAGIAHEINSPMGAIKSSSDSLLTSYNKLIEELPTLNKIYERGHGDVLIKIIKTVSSDDIDFLSTREERELKRKTHRTLEEKNISLDDDIIDILVEMNCSEMLLDNPNFFKSEYARDILNVAYSFFQTKKTIRTIRISSGKCAKIIFGLKTFSRFEDLNDLIGIELHTDIENILMLYRNNLKHGVEIKKIYCQDEIFINSYGDSLNQVWNNLIHNSLQAMNNKGELTIETKLTVDQVIVSISDNGPGVPDEIKGEIFNPFFTTKSKGEGSGLGLDIVKKIVERHHGKIEFTSVPGETVFTVILPLNN